MNLTGFDVTPHERDLLIAVLNFWVLTLNSVPIEVSVKTLAKPYVIAIPKDVIHKGLSKRLESYLNEIRKYSYSEFTQLIEYYLINLR